MVHGDTFHPATIPCGTSGAQEGVQALGQRRQRLQDLRLARSLDGLLVADGVARLAP